MIKSAMYAAETVFYTGRFYIRSWHFFLIDQTAIAKKKLTTVCGCKQKQ